jgi:hypothetical protein
MIKFLLICAATVAAGVIVWNGITYVLTVHIGG